MSNPNTCSLSAEAIGKMAQLSPIRPIAAMDLPPLKGDVDPGLVTAFISNGQAASNIVAALASPSPKNTTPSRMA